MCTLVPPGEYDWTCASFSTPESRAQMANRSVHPFLLSSRQKVPVLYNGGPFPRKLPLLVGVVTPIYFMIPWGRLSPQCPMGGSGPPSNTWFPGPTRVLNPNGISIGSAVLAGLTSVTDRPTDHATQSVTINRIYIRSTAMRSNNVVIFQ